MPHQFVAGGEELYALGLNPEFITNYVTTLRDDVMSFALQQLLKKAADAEAVRNPNGTRSRA